MQAIPYSFMSLWLKLNASVAHDNYDNLLTYKLWFWMVACLDVCPSVRLSTCPGQKRQMTIVAAPTQRNSTIVSAVSYPPSSPHQPWAFSKKTFLYFLAENEKYIFQVGPQFQSFRSLANFPSKWWFCWLCVCVSMLFLRWHVRILTSDLRQATVHDIWKRPLQCAPNQ